MAGFAGPHGHRRRVPECVLVKLSGAQPQFQRLLQTAREVQGRLIFLPAVAVGGTAAAVYARHRVSLDVDFVSPYLREKFDEVDSALREIPGFSVVRLRRPVLILGQLGDDEVGIRQLRREEPLEAVEHEGLWLPTLPELIRVKSFVLSDRRAVRDYVDVCALVETAGMADAVRAMQPFARLYRGLTTVGPLTAFAEAAHDVPADAPDVDLRQWRALRPEYQDLNRVRAVCEQFAIHAIESHAAT
jgi:hypothetical protein